jgi:hypothetical protein
MGFCESGSEPSGSLKCREFRDWIRTCLLLKKDSDPCRWLVISFKYSVVNPLHKMGEKVHFYLLTSISFDFIFKVWKNYVQSITGPGSSVDTGTDYGPDGPGIESRWKRDFPPVQTGPGAHPASCTMGTGSFPGVKCGRGVLLTTHPRLAPRSWKSRAITLPPSGLQLSL